MSILTILLLTCIALGIGWLARGGWRSWFLLAVSLLVIYALQPSTPIRHLDFWLPTLTIILVITAWIITSSAASSDRRTNQITGWVILLIILLIGLTRYLGDFCCLPSTPPAILSILIATGISLLLFVVLLKYAAGRSIWIQSLFIFIIVEFVFLKSDALAQLTSRGLRILAGQSTTLASPLDIRWLGFSYVAFRLLHTLRDRLSGRLPTLNLRDYLIYIIFFPSISAGPIDRLQHFSQQLTQPFQSGKESLLLGLRRIFLGVFTKFVLADALALFALNHQNASQVHSTAWLWVLLYAYALRIFFDFSGYTSIAIGLGTLVGIQLPENFDRPYLKQNLTLFWNSWHITLADWFRAYFFNPLTRALRSSSLKIPLPLIIFLGQLSTFVLIGLWHGISWNFALWGAWHGLGLFVHNRWSDFLKSRTGIFEAHQNFSRVTQIAGPLLTFHYVSLGWVWFALPNPMQSWSVFQKLIGIG